MRSLLLTTIALLLPVAASAGVYLEITERDLDDAKDKPDVQKLWFEEGRMRAEADTDSVQIFKNQTFYILDTEDKTYTVMDKASVEKMGDQLSQVKKQMEARMADLPPEQRAQIEQMMGKLGGDSAAKAAAKPPAKPKRTVTATSRTDKAAGQTCKVWEVIEDGVKEQELCVVAASALPGGDDVMKTLRELGSMFKSLAESMGAGASSELTNTWRDLESLNGLPVITREFENGKVTQEARLTTIKNGSPPATAFEVPAGYKSRTLDIGKLGE